MTDPRVGHEKLRGLSSQQARQLLDSVGRNVVVPEAVGPNVATLLTRAARDPMAIMLAAAAALYWLLGDRLDALIALGAAVPIVAVGALLEYRADRALEELRKTTRMTATVIRDGRLAVIPVDELVPGDVLLLAEGDVVPADALVVETTQLGVNEAVLTGEPFPVEKFAHSDPDMRVLRNWHSQSDPSLFLASPSRHSAELEVIDIDDSKKVFAGTTVVSGAAMAVVVATGKSTRYGALAAAVEEARPQPSPLQRKIHALVLRVGLVAVAFCIGVFVLELAGGSGLARAVSAAVSLGLAAVPEEFPLVFTLYLSLGAYRLARRNALVRKLTSVETLGSTTVICADKTGTVTEGKPELAAVWTRRSGLAERAELLRSGARQAAVDGEVGLPSASWVDLIESAVLATEREAHDPIDVAVQRFASEIGIDVGKLLSSELVVDYGFEDRSKYMAHVWQRGGEFVVCAKGSPEHMLAAVSIDPHERDAAVKTLEYLAARGMRLLAVAKGKPLEVVGVRSQDLADMHLVGLIAFEDPLREGVTESVAACMNAGIDVKLVTGDHPLTARAVAVAMGILPSAYGTATERGWPTGHRTESSDARVEESSCGFSAPGGRDAGHGDATPDVMTGEELDVLDDEELVERAKAAKVFARIRPEQKLRLVRSLQRRGEIVAMTGDGINDAAALKEASVGVAMGKRGTQVARSAADVVLLDDNFSTIVAAVADGRRIFDNLSKAFSFLVSFHVPLLLAALLVPLLRLPLLLLPIHMVVMELVLHPTVSLVFEAEPSTDDVMDSPPKPPERQLMTARRFAWAIGRGVLVLIPVIGLYLGSLEVGVGAQESRGAAFAALILGTMWLLASERAGEEPLWHRGLLRNRTLVPVLGATALVGALALYLPALARTMSMSGPSLRSMGGALVSVAIAALVSELAKVVVGWVERGRSALKPK